MNDIKEILSKYKSIAMIGVSNDPTKASTIVMKYMQKYGYKVYPVNPSAKGQKILRISKTKSIKKVETDIYLMNFYNSYLCRYFFNENRRIILTNSEDADHYNNLKYEKGYEVEPKVIIKSKKRNWIKKIL